MHQKQNNELYPQKRNHDRSLSYLFAAYLITRNFLHYEIQMAYAGIPDE